MQGEWLKEEKRKRSDAVRVRNVTQFHWEKKTIVYLNDLYWWNVWLLWYCMTIRRKGEVIWRSASKKYYMYTISEKNSYLTDCIDGMFWLFVIMRQESKDDLILKASRINLPSTHNSFTLFTLKRWTSSNTEDLHQ